MNAHANFRIWSPLATKPAVSPAGSNYHKIIANTTHVRTHVLPKIMICDCCVRTNVRTLSISVLSRYVRMYVHLSQFWKNVVIE